MEEAVSVWKNTLRGKVKPPGSELSGEGKSKNRGEFTERHEAKC